MTAVSSRTHFQLLAQLRDGRSLRLDAKPKTQLAIERFLSRGGGFFGTSPDQSLHDLGLENIVPSHGTRPGTLLAQDWFLVLDNLSARKTSDFVFRYMCKLNRAVTQESCFTQPTNIHRLTFQELAIQRHPSLGILCDASPKANMDAARFMHFSSPHGPHYHI